MTGTKGLQCWKWLKILWVGKIISVKQKDIKKFYKLLIEFYETNNTSAIKQFLYNNCIDGMNLMIRRYV